MTEFIGSQSDFDFLEGDWRIDNRRRVKILDGCDDWDEFPSTCRFQKLLGGVANVDEFYGPSRNLRGMSVRAFDIAARRWSIYWINGADGRLQPPVHGGFYRGRGEFFGEDTHAGRPVLVRYHWTADPDAPCWEQAYSPDRGASWEINWTMQFARA